MSTGPIRCRGPWKFHKRSSEQDKWLDDMGLFRKHIARDSSCLFRVVSENIYNAQQYFHQVRLDCIKFMAANRHLFEGSLTCSFENYLKEMSNPSEWGGLVEISAMSHLYRRDFVIYESNNGPQTKICNGYGKTIYLFYVPDTKHFDVVYTKDFISTSSFCQSLVYEILYDGVYQLKELSYAVDKMLYDKIQGNHIEYFMSENVERRKRQRERAKIFLEGSQDDKDRNNNALALKCKHHTKDLERTSLLKESLSIFVFNRSLIQLENVCLNCLNVNSAKDLLDHGITPFPYKVAKALDPDIYRNIEFDVWSELRREFRYGVKYSDGTTLQVGVKCLCKLQPEQTVPYHCHIQEMSEGGPCLVFIEELGEKRIINYEQLEPLPLEERRPWAPPYRYSRANTQFLTLSQMLQQIGNITRKQSLGKAKLKSESEEPKSPEKAQKTKISWSEVNEDTDLTFPNESLDYPTCQHLDFVNFEPAPAEVCALPLMVDGRAGSGGAPPEMATHPPQQQNQPANNENHHNQAGSSGEMGGHGVASPASVRASTPASTNNTLATYTGGASGGGVAGGGVTGGGAPVAYSMPGGCAPYVCGVKSVVWCAPHSPPPTGPMPGGGMPLGIGGMGVGPPQVPPHGMPPMAPLAPVPPPPHGVNPHVYKSVQANGADLPMNDIPTLRYYFNLGVECLWAAYGPPPHHPPPRHYSPRDLSQDMQQMSLHDRGGMNHNSGEQNHKHKPPNNDKLPLNQGKGNGQRPLVGPRFKRGGIHQDGNQNTNQNKGHTNNLGGGKGPNNRRNSHTEGRGNPVHGHYGAGGGGEAECMMDQPLLTVPYIPYPPPVYPIQYYPVEADPAMMGMMGGMGYVGYEEGVALEYGGVGMQPYYPPHAQYPPHAHAPPHHPHHPPNAHHLDHNPLLSRKKMKVEQIVGPVLLGEGPHWDEKQQCLFFVSILDKTIHKYVPATKKHTKTTLDGRPGFIVPVEGTADQFVVGKERKFVVIQWDGEEESEATVVKELGEVDHSFSENRINDGKADPRGRLFAGTMGYEEVPGAEVAPDGTLYRLDRDKNCKIEPIAGNISISNGLAWDLNEKAFYYTDSLERNIRRYDYDVETGAISNMKHIFDFSAKNIEGIPDGTTIDTDGNLWVAVFMGSCILKIDPRKGELLQKIPIPAYQITSATFGGPNYDILYVTSAKLDFCGEQKPPCGATFMVTGLGAKGHPNVYFKL
ncbi:hypothetical protein K1T71_001040 [Dendrolimus kikuchii]|uniref:Uncharacterized protein n=1 Tax=Dendrolimus kikuchii TaxID=765133 RepID=A0ACC1DGE8_9NEOP|nr:hypothetical protein K1T71_001040 [Dendrolimus kikuchii]